MKVRQRSYVVLLKNMFKKFLRKILGIEDQDLRIRKLERKFYWKEKYHGAKKEGTQNS